MAPPGCPEAEGGWDEVRVGESARGTLRERRPRGAPRGARVVRAFSTCTGNFFFPLVLFSAPHHYLPLPCGEPVCRGCGIGRQARLQWLSRWLTIATGAVTRQARHLRPPVEGEGYGRSTEEPSAPQGAQACGAVLNVSRFDMLLNGVPIPMMQPFRRARIGSFRVLIVTTSATRKPPLHLLLPLPTALPWQGVWAATTTFREEAGVEASVVVCVPLRPPRPCHPEKNLNNAEEGC